MDALCHENDDGFGTDWGATMNIGGWLRNLGLERYEPVFIENAIDSDVLPVLTEGDFEKLGIPMGDRKRLIKAIRAMLAGSPTTFTTESRMMRKAGNPAGLLPNAVTSP
jgi:SAM domain (Sterile alpha motif)